MTRERAADDLQCIEFVDLVTAYLDGELKETERRRTDKHLEGCEGCGATLEQWQTVIHLAGRLTAADFASIDPLIRDRLMATFPRASTALERRGQVAEGA